MTAPALYIHVPFCHSECTYCDFYRQSYREALADRFLLALAIELRSLALPAPPPTIYVGGGTPSALGEAQLAKLLECLLPWRHDGQEVTFEVNPRSATAAKVRMLAQAGVNRVSFGAQTFDAGLLKLLGRRHGPADIRSAYALLRELIPSLSFDLIFALPGQTLAGWKADLDSALELRPDHLSVYSLIHEPGTPLWRQVEAGELAPAPEELEREMFLTGIETLEAAGYEHYEVSSFARPGHRSRHNQIYWAQRDYVGVGPGAASTVRERRHTNVPDLEGYIRGLAEHGAPPRTEETLGVAELRREHVMLRLRTSDGLSLDEFDRAFGVTFPEYAGGALERLSAMGLLSTANGRVRLTRAGLCVADKIVAELVA